MPRCCRSPGIGAWRLAETPTTTELFCPVCVSTEPGIPMEDHQAEVTCNTCGTVYSVGVVVKIVEEFGHAG